MVTSTQIGKNGRFGNQLFQIAALVGYGYKNSLDVKLPRWYCELSDTLFEEYFPNYTSTEINESDFFNMYNEPFFKYNEIPLLDNLNLKGYFQSFRYFNDFENEIKKLFSPKNEIIKKDDNIVSLHIRRGDYKLHSLSHAIVDGEYYKKCYDYYGHDKTYFIFSDSDIEEAYSIVPFIKNKEYLSNDKIINEKYICSDKNITSDFFNMISCNKHIIANSSLSWWSGWLSGGDVIAPSKWFTDNYAMNIGFKQNDLIPNNWKII